MIIKSMLDEDLYKFSTQMFALELFPDAIAEYRFFNRGLQRFNKDFLEALKQEINELQNLVITQDEIDWLKENCGYFKTWYFDYLKNYRYNPSQVSVKLTEDNNLDLVVRGKWIETTLWEIKLMAIISELYFNIVDTNWDMYGQKEKAYQKGLRLELNDCVFSEFGTRRRRDFETQDLVVDQLRLSKTCSGTSNVYLAMKYNLIAQGTLPHESIQAMQVLCGIANCNYYIMDNWSRVYSGDLGVVLTDTLGVDQFLKNFNLRFAKLFSGTRQDSGNEFEYTDKIVSHYRRLKIDPMSKFIVFSNALDADKAIKIRDYCDGKIIARFGIGTWLSNDFVNSPALNMVIKLWSINNKPCVKISDSKGKAMGDPSALRVAKWLINGTPLD